MGASRTSTRKKHRPQVHTCLCVCVCDVNRILTIVRSKKNRVVFRKIGEKEDLCLIGVTDASYNQTDNAVSGIIIMIGNRKTKAVSPIYWKSGVIRKVCLSPKAAETRSMVKIVDDS